MKVNLKKLFVASIIGAGVFVSQPATFIMICQTVLIIQNNLINSARNYILSGEVIGHTGKIILCHYASIIFLVAGLYLWKREKEK